jgi:hypothetical protein
MVQPLPEDSIVVDQDGVLLGTQAIQLFGRGYVRAQLAARRWHRPVRGVIVLHNGPLTESQRRWVALLAAAPDSALGGLTALTVDGFDGFAVGRPQVVQPMGARRPTYRDVVPHWSIYLGDADVHPLRRPRRTRPARSLLDEASWTTIERRARALVLAGVQQRIVRPRDLRESLTRRGACRHRGLIVESILDAVGGIQSLPELDFEMIRRRFGLPEPERQAVRRRRDGKCYLDVDWPDFDTACEIHGVPHIRVLQWESDLERANEISIAGPRSLVFSSYAVRHQQPRVGDQLVRMLRRGGWRS